MADVPSVVVPAGHALQKSLPSSSWNDPRGQLSQIFVLSLNIVPTGHLAVRSIVNGT